MRKLAIGLWVSQCLSAFAMIGFAAGYSIESILATGPILACTGLLLGLATRPLQSWSILAFALSAPAVCTLIAILIAVFNLSPEEATSPTIVILGAYIVLMLPLAILSWRAIYRWSTFARNAERRLLQFSIKTLLIVMTSVCIVVGACKLIFVYVGLDELLIFGGFAIVSLLLCGLVIWRFMAKLSSEDDRL